MLVKFAYSTVQRHCPVTCSCFFLKKLNRLLGKDKSKTKNEGCPVCVLSLKDSDGLNWQSMGSKYSITTDIQ